MLCLLFDLRQISLRERFNGIGCGTSCGLRDNDVRKVFGMAVTGSEQMGFADRCKWFDCSHKKDASVLYNHKT